MPAMLVGIALSSFARIYFGVHYPSDCIAGKRVRGVTLPAPHWFARRRGAGCGGAGAGHADGCGREHGVRSVQGQHVVRGQGGCRWRRRSLHAARRTRSYGLDAGGSVAIRTVWDANWVAIVVGR